MKRIQDEFTNLPITIHRKYQLRRRKRGLCVWCGGSPLATNEYCEAHRLEKNKQNKEYRALNKKYEINI